MTITSVDPSTAMSDVRWSAYDFVPGGSVFGRATPWRSFPATIPAHGTIRIRFTLHRPDREALFPKGGTTFSDGDLQVHWHSLLHTHVSDVPGLIETVSLC